jgi:hypothetical protein
VNPGVWVFIGASVVAVVYSCLPKPGRLRDDDFDAPAYAPDPTARRAVYEPITAGRVFVYEHGIRTEKGVEFDLVHHESDLCLGDVLDYLAEIDVLPETTEPEYA